MKTKKELAMVNDGKTPYGTMFAQDGKSVELHYYLLQQDNCLR